jgi:NADH:ubiquinone oxidoreductase subunit 3 (subunit A)
MIIFSSRDSDTPLGTGYRTVAVIIISAILTVIMTLRAPRKVADAEPQQDHRSRPYDAADPSRSPAAGRARVPSMPKQLIIGALLQVVSISLGVGLGYLAFLNVFSILDR